MSPEMHEPPAEYTMTIEELRCEVRNCWDRERALRGALRYLPAVPPHIVLDQLSDAAKWPEDNARGSQLQRVYGPELVPFKSEMEDGAGLWSLIREGIMAGRRIDSGKK